MHARERPDHPIIGKERLYIALFVQCFTPLSLKQVSRIDPITVMKMNYFRCLTLASLAIVAVSSREFPSSSSKPKGKRGLFDPAGSSIGPESLYRHQLDGYRTQDSYSRGQGQLYQRSVPHASQQQNQVGPPQTYYQSEGGSAGLSKYYSQGGSPLSQKYYPSVKGQSYNHLNLGKPSADGYQQKTPYAKSPYYSTSEPNSYSSYSPYSRPHSSPPPKNYQIQYQSQDLPKNHQPQYQKPEQQSYISKYPELVQKQLQEAINFQKERLNQASSFGSFQSQYQPAVEQQQQPQYSTRTAEQYAEPSAQQQQYSTRAAQQYAEPSEQYSSDQYQQQSEQAPESANQFYNQYLQIVNKQGFIQTPYEGDSYQQYQQSLGGQDAQESFARPTRYLASGQLLNYKNSDLEGV